MKEIKFLYIEKVLSGNMENIKEKFKIPEIETLKQEQIMVLKKINREGIRHLKYYHSTMDAFRFPELRVKTQDTVYYEEVLPIIAKILMEHESIKQQKQVYE
jgi:hypothetical protein